MSQKATILIVDDEPDVRDVLEEYFITHGYTAIGAESAGAARAIAAKHPIDLALVDINMPGEDGLSLARHLRECYTRIAIVMLTSASTVLDRVVGLEMGADDYVPKPFDPRELLARIKSVLRRVTGTPAASGPRVRMGRRVLDLEKRMLVDPADGSEETLTASEFDLLKLFAENPNRPLSRDWLLETTSHREMEAFDRAIDIRILRIRRKIEVDPAHPTSIRTVRSAGYMFVPPDD